MGVHCVRTSTLPTGGLSPIRMPRTSQDRGTGRLNFSLTIIVLPTYVGLRV